MQTPANANVILQDLFEDNVVEGRYTPIGNADLTEVNGEMIITTNSPGDGVFFDLSDLGGFSICHAFDFSTVDNLAVGTFLRWEWIVNDGTSNFVLLESEWTNGNSVSATTRKMDANGQEVTVIQKIIDSVNDLGRFGRDNFETRWDRRNHEGVEQVRLELIDSDTDEIFELFPWQDPNGFATVGFAITTDLESVNFGALTISSNHVPEPSSLYIVATGFTILLTLRRRKCLPPTINK